MVGFSPCREGRYIHSFFSLLVLHGYRVAVASWESSMYIDNWYAASSAPTAKRQESLLKQLSWYREFFVDSLHPIHELFHRHGAFPIAVGNIEGSRIGGSLLGDLER